MYNCALVSWEKYDEIDKTMSYTIGRFMKTNCPIPDGMDFIDIPAGKVGIGYIQGGGDAKAQKLLKEYLAEQGEYDAATWIWSAEVYPKFEIDDWNTRYFGSYIALIEK